MLINTKIILWLDNLLRCRWPFHSLEAASITQPAQRRRKDIVKTSYFWSERRLRLVWNGRRDDLFKDVVKTSSRKRPQDVFQETSSRPLPGDVLKMSKTSPRLLEKAKNLLETIYRFSIYIRLELLTYYHSIISYTN